MLKLLGLLLLLGVVCADIAPVVGGASDYESWKGKHGINYAQDEDRYRLFLYRQKKAEIAAHNQNPEHGWTKGENQFSALTKEEFVNTYLGLIPPSYD
jgi:hypothetical protein